METSFWKSHYIKITSALVICGAVLFAFIGFRSLGLSEKDRISKNLNAILRNEIAVSNSFALSKVIADLESLSVIQCAKLVEIGELTRIFYNTVEIKKCNLSWSKYFIQADRFTALNGLKYELTYVPALNIYALSLEFITYILILFFGLVLARAIQRRIDAENFKIQHLRYEQKELTDKANQLTHDIASPLSSLKMMASLLHNVDPEIRGILEGSIQRTQDIIDDLKKKNQDSKLFTVTTSLQDIIKEKRQLFSNCILEFITDEKNQNLEIVGSESNFKRVISNLLNNSYEALSEKPGKIQIRLFSDSINYQLLITDNGKGIPAHILQKVGTKGFSFSKEGHATAGSGLGIYNAKQVVEQMNGSLYIESNLGQGTTIKIIFPIPIRF